MSTGESCICCIVTCMNCTFDKHDLMEIIRTWSRTVEISQVSGSWMECQTFLECGKHLESYTVTQPDSHWMQPNPCTNGMLTRMLVIPRHTIQDAWFKWTFLFAQKLYHRYEKVIGNYALLLQHIEWGPISLYLFQYYGAMRRLPTCVKGTNTSFVTSISITQLSATLLDSSLQPWVQSSHPWMDWGLPAGFPGGVTRPPKPDSFHAGGLTQNHVVWVQIP